MQEVKGNVYQCKVNGVFERVSSSSQYNAYNYFKNIDSSIKIKDVKLIDAYDPYLKKV